MKDTKLRKALQETGLIYCYDTTNSVTALDVIRNLRLEDEILRKKVEDLEQKLASLVLTLRLEWIPAWQAPPRWEKREADARFGKPPAYQY